MVRSYTLHIARALSTKSGTNGVVTAEKRNIVLQVATRPKHELALIHVCRHQGTCRVVQHDMGSVHKRRPGRDGSARLTTLSSYSCCTTLSNPACLVLVRHSFTCVQSTSHLLHTPISIVSGASVNVSM
jgi:hypothetical protein